MSTSFPSPDTSPEPDESEVIVATLDDIVDPAEPVGTAPDDSDRLPAVRRTARVMVTVATHDYTKRTVRPFWTMLQGFESWAQRAWDASTMGTFRRMIRAAEAAGDREALKEWVELKEQAAERRWRRLMELPKMLQGLAIAIAVALLAIPAAVLVISVLVAITGSGSFEGVWNGFVQALGVALIVGTYLWIFLSYGGFPALVCLLAYREGVRRGQPPRWLVTAAEMTVGMEVNESSIAQALAALRISTLRDYLKENTLTFLTPARSDAARRGTEAVLRLPAGVTAAEVIKRRDVFAANLHRSASEVWLKTGGEAGILDLWVADKGVLELGAGDYPLLAEGKVDVFNGVPAGVTLRGEDAAYPIMGANGLVAGAPGQGKSTAARTIMAGVALDPTAELRIYVMAHNYDFDVFAERCSDFRKARTATEVQGVRDALESLAAEVQRREHLLTEHQSDKVTRKLASAGVGLHPLVVLVEEAHNAFGHPEHGKDISALAVDVLLTGRKCGVHLLVSTQAPNAQTIPPLITGNVSTAVGFHMRRWQTNDTVFGQGSYAEGIDATALRAGTEKDNGDRGTSITTGLPGLDRGDAVQWFRIPTTDGVDQAGEVVRRSLKALKGNVPTAPVEVETRDLLSDLAEVIDPGSKVKLSDLPARLRKLAPDWSAYAKLDGPAIHQRLSEAGIRTTSSGRQRWLDYAALSLALLDRETSE